MSRLVPCPGCNRHVRIADSKCPFCDGALELAAMPEPAFKRSSFARGAAFTLGASLISAGAVGACKDNSLPPPVAEPEVAAPVYGAPAPFPPDAAVAPPAPAPPPIEGSNANGGAAATPDDPLVAAGAPPERHAKPVYGGPPQRRKP